MRTILVTGGAGFIGSAVVRQLLDETEDRVVTIDKLTYAGTLASIPQADSHPRHAFVRADICDRAAMERVFAEYRPGALMHLAAESHVDRSIDAPGDFIRTNLIGTYTLLETALDYWRGLDDPADRAAFRFHHVSTDEVYGSLGEDGAFTETSRYEPNSPYSASKAGADHLVRAWGATYGLPVVLTNCSNNYGPRQFPEKLIPLMVIRGMAGRPLPVYGDGGHVRDWLYVEDHARALRLAADRGVPGRSYNVGGRSERTNLQIVEAVCGILDELAPSAEGPHHRLITFVTDRPGHDRRYAIDPGRIERELGWRPRESFESGLRKTVRWYLDNRDWWQAILDRGYRAERLGLERRS